MRSGKKKNKKADVIGFVKSTRVKKKIKKRTNALGQLKDEHGAILMECSNQIDSLTIQVEFDSNCSNTS